MPKPGGFLHATLRILRKAALVVLALLLATTILVQIQQQIFRHRCEHLLADMQSIRLHQTTWAQAQTLMNRWGAWGHYDGACNSTNCKYMVTLEDAAAVLYASPHPSKYVEALRRAYFWKLYQIMGGKAAAFQVGFIVQDGTIWRTTVYLQLDVEPAPFSTTEDVGYGLFFRAQSRQALNREPRNGFPILGNDEQIADHPNYKVGRPGGCESCIEAVATYTLSATPEEIHDLSNIQFRCFTAFYSCKTPADLDPAAKKRDLENSPWGSARATPEHPLSPVPCRTPVWAQGRDALDVLVVDTIASDPIGEQNYIHPTIRVRLAEVLKGDPAKPVGSPIWVLPHTEDRVNYTLPDAPEPMRLGHRYLLLANYAIEDLARRPFTPTTPDRPLLQASRCGLLEDTPQNRAELQKGFALNDHLRVPEF